MESVDANESVAADEDASTDICIAESCPGRTVFSEQDNPEGWIGTDLTVDVEP